MNRFIAVRSRKLSLWQSAVHQTTERRLAADPTRKALMHRAVNLHVEAESKGKLIRQPQYTPGALLTLEDHVHLSKASFELAEARRTNNSARAQAALALYRDYSEFDPKWMECIT